MSSPDSQSDAALHAELRAVPLPENLLPRLRGIALRDDADLDAAICNVRIPPLLSEMLRETMHAEREDQPTAMDGVVTAHRDWRRSHQTVAKHKRGPWSSWANSTAGWLAIGLSACGVLLVPMLVLWIRHEQTPAIIAVPAPAELADRVHQPKPEPKPSPELGDTAKPEPSEVAEVPLSVPAAVPNVEPPADEQRQQQWHEQATPAEIAKPDRPAPPQVISPASGMPSHPWPEGLLASRDVDTLAELRKVTGPSPQGIKPPLVPAFPLDAYTRSHVHPFVSPAANPKLCVSTVPLGVDTASYELTRRYLEGGELPPPEKVRTEEFLAALDYQYPDAQQQPVKLPVRLFTAGGPSPFGGEGLTLLQIGVQGRRFRHENHPPTHLVLAVDVSASMCRGGRLDMVRKALGKLLPCLGAEDRISLVSFNEIARVVAENADARQPDALLTAAASLVAQGPTNVAKGLRQAYETAERPAAAKKATTCVVLVTDTTVALDALSATMIEQRLAEAAAQQVRLEVLDLGESPNVDSQLAAFAAAGRGKARRVATADQVYWAMLEAVNRRSTLLARDVQLTVTFDPKTVREYRLLGHESTAVANFLPDHPQADFHVGQSATALYEIRMKPGVQQQVAAVELSWQPLQGGDRQSLTRKIPLKQFAPTFAGAAPSLQEAALAARTAELLRNIPGIARGPRPFFQVLRLSREVDRRLYERPSFAELVALLEQADKAKPSRGTRK